MADLRCVEQLGRMAARLEDGEAVVLERALDQRSAAQKEHAGLVKKLRAQLAVPAPPALQRLFGQRRVRLVGTVLETHHLADVGGGGQRVR